MTNFPGILPYIYDFIMNAIPAIYQKLTNFVTNINRVNVSRSLVTTIHHQNVASLGASYTHVKSLKGVVGPDTKRIVMYHAFLTAITDLTVTNHIQHAYLGFNRITGFTEADRCIKKIDVLDLVGNPIKSLVNCPPCRELIVSSTLIENLIGCPDVEIIRCGHSTHLKSLQGCPDTVKIIECSCAPNLVINYNDLPSGLVELIF